jgi:hypothetical protein
MFRKLIGLVIAVIVVVTSVAIVKAEDVDLTGTYLKDEYIVIPPSVTDSKGDVHKLIDDVAGTVEFWIKPDWKPGNTNKDYIKLFFYGNWSNLNSIWIYEGKADSGGLIISKSYKRLAFSIPFYGGNHKNYNLDASVWHHVAICWDFSSATKITNLFWDGKNIGLMHPQPKDYDAGISGWDGIAFETIEPDMFIGAANKSNGLKDDKLDTSVLPEFEVAQFRISDMPRYDSEFTPKAKLVADKNTIFYMPLADDLDGDIYKNGKKTIKVRAKSVKIETSKKK